MRISNGIIFGLIILTLAMPSYAEEIPMFSCDVLTGLCIEIEFQTAADTTTDVADERYQFPYYAKQGDYLFVKRFYVINNDNKSSREMTFFIEPHPLGYKDLDQDLKQVFIEGYGRWQVGIPKLNPHESLEINYSGNKTWKTKTYAQDSKNVPFDFYRIELYKEGEWIIAEAATCPNNSCGGYDTIIQGKWRGNVFQVNPPLEITNLVDAGKSLYIALAALIVSVLALIIALVDLYLAMW